MRTPAGIASYGDDLQQPIVEKVMRLQKSPPCYGDEPEINCLYNVKSIFSNTQDKTGGIDEENYSGSLFCYTCGNHFDL